MTIMSYRSVTTDGGVHRRCVPEMDAAAMAWLGEPLTEAYARRYETHRLVVMQGELDRLVASHSIAEGSERARLAAEIADLNGAIGQSTARQTGA